MNVCERYKNEKKFLHKYLAIRCEAYYIGNIDLDRVRRFTFPRGNISKCVSSVSLFYDLVQRSFAEQLVTE